MTNCPKPVSAKKSAQDAAAMAQASGKMHGDVSELPAELQELVKRMLVEGATVEDTVEAVNNRGGESVTPQAVQSFFRSNLGLQQQRVQWQIETARVLKEALGNSESSMKEMADAVLMTGLMRVTRSEANFDVAHAMKERLERENLALRQRCLRLKARDYEKKQEYQQARLRTEEARHKKIKLELGKIKDGLRAARKGGKLDGETLQKIQEIYGLIKQPIVPASAENSEAQA